MKSILGVLLVAAIAVCATSQNILDGGVQPSNNDLSAESAAHKASLFVDLVGHSPMSIKSFTLRLEKRPGRKGERVWQVYTPTARVQVHSVTGEITFFVNAKRQDDRYRNRGRTGEKFTTSEAVTKAHIRALATKLGVPASVKQATFKMVGDGVGQDSNPLGRFGSVFKNDAGQIVATLSCDLQDGVVLSYSRSREK